MSETIETKKTPGFRIIGLRAENFKRLSLVEMTPPRHLVKISGKNEQGKSSLMDCIGAALDGGFEFLQSEPIRQGKDKSVVRVTIGNDGKPEMIITKTMRRREDGTTAVTLVVENAEGFRTTSPQTMIAQFIGPLTFDPGKFMLMKPELQFDQIAGMVPGIDFRKSAAENDSDYKKRTDVNRDAKRARAAADAIQVPDSIDAETQPVDEVALTAELAGAGKHNASIETRKERRAKVQQEIDDGPTRLKAIEDSANALIKSSQDRLVTDLKQIDEEIARLQEKRINLNKDAEDHQNKLAAECLTGQAGFRAHIASLQETLDNAEPLPDPIDTEALTSRITEARRTNAAIRLRDQRATHVAEAETLEAESDRLTKAMDARDKAKEEAIAAAKLPVSGLSLGQNAKGDGVVMLDGLPLAQASRSKKLRVSALIAMALNPKLSIMLIQDAAFLDEDSMEILSEMAIEHDFQIWCEIVDGSGKIGFVIEDGHLQGVEPPKEDAPAPTGKGKKATIRTTEEKLF